MKTGHLERFTANGHFGYDFLTENPNFHGLACFMTSFFAHFGMYG